MEFKNRVSNAPGVIQLKDMETGEIKTYEMILADNPSQMGTPITAEILEQFKQEILDSIEGVGLKGEKGEPGANGTYITAISITR